MSTEFQIIFTSIMTLLAGLALFVLRSVFKKFEIVEQSMKDIQGVIGGKEGHGERIKKLETIIEICPACGGRGNK